MDINWELFGALLSQLLASPSSARNENKQAHSSWASAIHQPLQREMFLGKFPKMNSQLVATPGESISSKCETK